jgi:hypothetical protein
MRFFPYPGSPTETNTTPMKTIAALLSLVACASWAGPTMLYVSESGEKRIAIYSLDEKSGDLTRTGEAQLPGAPGSLPSVLIRRIFTRRCALRNSSPPCLWM